jgi:hypothetical protein
MVAMKQFIEHVACSGVGKVERDLGWLLGRIGH